MKIEQQAQTRAFLIPIIRQRQGGNVHSTAVGAALRFPFFQKAIHRKSLILCIK